MAKKKAKRAAKAAKITVDPAELAFNEALEPLRAYCEAERGNKAKLVKAVQAVLPVHRTNVEQWISRTKPVQPRLGAGLVLLKVFSGIHG